MSSYPHDLEAAARQGRTLSETGHRPYPLPQDNWIMGQTWEQLAFLHWRIPEVELRRVVHPSVPIDSFDGSAWLGITPFTVTGFHVRHTPPPPAIANFHEINVRTYATVDGKPGIYFLSLDAASKLAVHAARTAYRVPYFHSDIATSQTADRVEYSSERNGDPPAAFEAEYGPTGPKYEAEPGSFDHWCTERYCLYTLDDDQRLQRGDIHHPPWPLQPATARIARNTMTQPYGIELEGDPFVHFAARQDVVFWTLQPVERDG
jgi:uncharacterized protein